jgi:hypothetical protein
MFLNRFVFLICFFSVLVTKAQKSWSGSVELVDLDGNAVSFQSISNKPIVGVVFLSRGCDFSVLYESRIIQLAKNMPSQEMELILVFPTRLGKEPKDMPEALKKWKEQLKLDIKILRDPHDLMTGQLGITRTPEAVVLKKRTEGWGIYYTGMIDDSPSDSKKISENYLLNALESVSAGKVPNVTKQRPIGCSIF